jgi:TRAP-type mannitol/chloroaromatic compound transport system permease large subunit
MGAVGAIGLAAMHKRLTWKLTYEGMASTMRITAMVIYILIGSTVFGLVFRGVDGDLWIERLLTSLPGGVVGFLLFVNLFVFVLAFFLDFFEIAFIIIPLLAPVAQKLGIDLIWFGVLLGANMQTSFMHPPFGFALFYLRGIAPREVKSSDIYWGALPWVALQLILVAILIFWPGLVTEFVPRAPEVDATKVEIRLEPAPDANAEAASNESPSDNPPQAESPGSDPLAAPPKASAPSADDIQNSFK